MSKTNRCIVSILALCVLGGAVFLTMTLISPSAPLPVDTSATEFSAGRAMQDLAVIAREPHPTGDRVLVDGGAGLVMLLDGCEEIAT